MRILYFCLNLLSVYQRNYAVQVSILDLMLLQNPFSNLSTSSVFLSSLTLQITLKYRTLPWLLPSEAVGSVWRSGHHYSQHCDRRRQLILEIKVHDSVTSPPFRATIIISHVVTMTVPTLGAQNTAKMFFLVANYQNQLRVSCECVLMMVFISV